MLVSSRPHTTSIVLSTVLTKGLRAATARAQPPSETITADSNQRALCGCLCAVMPATLGEWASQSAAALTRLADILQACAVVTCSNLCPKLPR